MRISAYFMPFFALVAGFSGYYLRLMELWNVFDEQTGLPQRGAGITIALIALTIAFLIIIAVFAVLVRLKRSSPHGFENAFGTESLAYPFIIFIIGIVWLGATVKYFIEINAAETMQVSEVVFAILSALSAISAAFFAMEIYQDPRRKTKLALCVIPTLFMCYWLILLYKRNASNPILLSYCYQCLAIISSTLGFYFTSGYVYNRLAPAKTIFAFLAAIYFCFVALADKQATSIKLIFIVIIAINLIYSSMLIKNLTKKSPKSTK